MGLQRLALKKVQYQAIDKVLGRGIGSVSLLCRVADASRKSYYYHLRHSFSTADAEITDVIRRLQSDHKGSISYRPMTRLVSQEYGKTVNRKRVRRLMKENDLLSAVRRRKWSDEVYARRQELKANLPADLIKQNFFALAPRKRMLEDITYLPGLEKTMYLNTIEDLYNGEILAYCISDSPNAKLCADTIENLCTSWGECFSGSIVHNDLGSSYVSYEYSDAVKAHGMIQSIGRVATCYDNAPMESLNGIIKTKALYCRFGRCTQPIKQKYREAVSVPPDSRFPTAGLAVSASPEWRCFYAGKFTSSWIHLQSMPTRSYRR